MQDTIKLQDIKDKLASAFKKLEFDEASHSYTLEGVNFKSVSSFIKDYSQPFDAFKIAGFIARKKGVTIDVILKEWEDSKNLACDLGTNVHLFGETYPIEGGSPSNGYEEAIVKFWEELPSYYIPVAFELKMYCKDKAVAGTTDFILYNIHTGKFVIADYKTNKDLFKNHKNQKLKAPFNNILDCPYGKYTIQTSFYQSFLESIEGVEVEGRWIIWVKPDGTYSLHYPDNIIETIESIYKA